MKAYKKDFLSVQIHDTRAEMGAAAARDIKACILSLLEKKETINMIFAAAPSQNEVLWGLATDREIPWNRVNAFHMDEYIGLPADAPQGFGNFLKEHIFGLADFKQVFYIDVTAKDAETECDRYAALLRQYPTDIVYGPLTTTPYKKPEPSKVCLVQAFFAESISRPHTPHECGFRDQHFPS